jgi:hypothetical protein
MHMVEAQRRKNVALTQSFRREKKKAHPDIASEDGARVRQRRLGYIWWLFMISL